MPSQNGSRHPSQWTVYDENHHNQHNRITKSHRNTNIITIIIDTSTMRAVPCFPDPPTGLDYTHVPRVMEINNPDGILLFFGNSAFTDMFKTYNVNGDGNCAYYCVQLYIEWKYSIAHSDNNAVVSVAVFRQQFRQHLQNVGINYYSRYLTRPDTNQILNQVYNPAIPNVMDYYNFVRSDSVLPENQWGTDDYIQIIARWFGIQYVVIFSNDYITIADLRGDDDNGKAPIKLYVNSDDNRTTFMDMLLSMPRNDTLFLYHTGNHYMWLKVEECLLSKAIQKSYQQLLHCNEKKTPKKRKSSQGENKDEEAHTKSPVKSPIKCNFCMSKNKECMICYDHQPNIAFSPCGHVLICKDCWDNINNGNINDGKKLSECPYCRAHISDFLRVYF